MTTPALIVVLVLPRRVSRRFANLQSAGFARRVQPPTRRRILSPTFVSAVPPRSVAASAPTPIAPAILLPVSIPTATTLAFAVLLSMPVPVPVSVPVSVSAPVPAPVPSPAPIAVLISASIAVPASTSFAAYPLVRSSVVFSPIVTRRRARFSPPSFAAIGGGPAADVAHRRTLDFVRATSVPGDELAIDPTFPSRS